MDAAYLSMESKKWEPVVLDVWRGSEETAGRVAVARHDDRYDLIKRERLPDGRVKPVTCQRAGKWGTLLHLLSGFRRPLRVNCRSPSRGAGEKLADDFN